MRHAMAMAARGRQAPLVMFMGANGFPAQVYTPVFHHLERLLDLTVVPHDYHRLLAPSRCKDWRPLVDDVVETAARHAEASGAAIMAVGHSAGGALFACAAARRPDLFEDMVIVDSPMFSPRKRLLYSLSLHLPDALTHRLHPLIRSAVSKPHRWETPEDAAQYVRSRRLFQSFDDDVLQAFLEHGLATVHCHGGGGGAVTLAFPRLHEANMYKTTPFETPLPLLGDPNGHLGQYAATSSTGMFAYSSQHDFISAEDVAWLRTQFPNLAFEPFRGGHFWPMQDPLGFARLLAGRLGAGLS